LFDGVGIIYNHAITSKGRINFTLAHEFGHYLIHRALYPNGFQCGQQQIVRWDSESVRSSISRMYSLQTS
jgi:hypothetical protein